MADKQTNPDDPLRELDDNLRPAVEEVRAEPMPAESVRRSAERARRLKPRPTRRAWRPARHHLALAAVAALLFLGLGLIQPPRPVGYSPDGHSITLAAVLDDSKSTNESAPTNGQGADRAWNRAREEAARRVVALQRARTMTPGAVTNGEFREAVDQYALLNQPPDSTANYTRKDKDRSFTHSKPLTAGGANRPVAPEEPAVEFAPRGTSRTPVTAGESRDHPTSGGTGKDLPPRVPPVLSRIPALRTESKQLGEAWGELSAKDRLKKIQELTRKLAPEDRKAVQDYLRELSENCCEPCTSKGKPEEKGPRVWKRDAARPSFARVYVGDGNALELVSLHVSVSIDGPRARTLVDHVFRNPHGKQLEGTFEYPLPSGASPSYFAMFLGQTRDSLPPLFRRGGGAAPLPAEALARLQPSELVKQIDTADWGKLQEARVVSQQKALEAYEEVVRGRIDPAVLEYAGGNTFRGRVFPIPAKGYNRVLMAYEELLPVSSGEQVYRFNLPATKLSELRFSLEAEASKGASILPKGDKVEKGKDALVRYQRSWKDEKPEGEVVFRAAPADGAIQAISGRNGDSGPHYLFARVRPEMPKVERVEPFANHAVFLLDTSLSEGKDRIAVSLRLLQAILEGDTEIKSFNVLTFNAAPAWVSPRGWLPNTKEGRQQLLASLDGLLLEGATDLSAALEKLCSPGFAVEKGTPLNCFLLSDGNLTWGESDVPTLVSRFRKRCPFPTRWHCYRTGLGEENAELYDALARDGGGVFQVFGDAELASAAKAHQRQCLTIDRVKFQGGPEATDLLVAGQKSAVYPGGELVLAARFAKAGPTKLVVEGKFQGRKVAQTFDLEVKDGGELAPRAWGELAVSSLLALNDARLEPLATAYCQEFGIASKVASFLVLENEADFKRLNLEEERGKTFKGDLGGFVNDAWAGLGQEVSPRLAFARLLDSIDARTRVLSGPEGEHVKKLLSLMEESDFSLPTGETLHGVLLKEKEADKAYLASREADLRAVNGYLEETKRRAKAGDLDGAVRVLSSVIEQNPSRGDALRLVGYRLLDLHQPAQAARLFSRVQRSRPFEPHSYRDLARSLEDAGQYALAAVQYETVLAGTWHNRFGGELKTVVREEYARMMQTAIREGKVRGKVADHFGERLEKMRDPAPQADLRVTISWNTDATDVDLWVIEPDGTKVFYQNRTSPAGGSLSQDMTQGYGPERYAILKAKPGKYRVVVHYFRANPNLLGGETHVNVVVTRNAGRPGEVAQRHTVILKQEKEEATVCKVPF